MKGSGDFSIGSQVWPGTSKLIEEVGELQVELGKLQQTLGKLIATHGDTNHWSGDLRARLCEEIGDTLAAITFFREKNMGGEDFFDIENRTFKKLELFRKWHAEPMPVVGDTCRGCGRSKCFLEVAGVSECVHCGTRHVK